VTDSLPSREQWLNELKPDGYRANHIARCNLAGYAPPHY